MELDESLIRASQNGDQSAFARLLALLYDLIFRFAMRWAKGVSDAEDITQQVCIKLARVIGQFRFESAFTSWLYRLVVNCARDWSRAQQRHRYAFECVPEPHSDNDVTEARAEIDRVLKVVEAMGEGFKETVILVCAEGLSHREAAEILGVKESTVSWRLHAIRKQLQENARAPSARESKPRESKL